MHKYTFLALLILGIALVLGVPVFFMIYWDSVSYFVKEDYVRLARLIFIPIVVLLAIIVTYKSIKADRKRNDLNWSVYCKQLPGFIAAMVAVYFVAGFLFSSMLLFINVNCGTPEPFLVKGKVIDKYKYQGSKSHTFLLTIRNEIDGKTYKFNTDWDEIDQYNTNDRFEKEMKKGLFGFVYLNQ